MNALRTRLNPAPDDSRAEATAAFACSHCGAGVPSGMIDSQSPAQFCCRGCRTAYALIHEHGLEAYYLRNQPTGQSVGDSPLARSFCDFDQAAFEQLYVRLRPDGRKESLLVLHGIHCAACLWLLEKLPQLVPGVSSAKVNWSRSTVEVVWQPEQTALSEIARMLNRLGYAPAPVRSGAQQAAVVQENRRQLVNLGVAAALAGNNMLLGAALYFGLLSQLGSSIETLFRGASCLLGLASVLGPGRTFLRTAWSALRTRTPHVDIPVAIALLMGSLSGLWNTLAGRGEIYFDSLSSLVALLLVGRYIQFRQQRQTAEAVDLLYRLTPRSARKLIDGVVVETLVDLLEPGDRIEVLPGQGVPADGTIMTGHSTLDESLLTGEARPVVRVAGEAVFASTQNLSGPLEITVTRTGRQTRMGRLMELMEAASRDKPPVIEWSNRAGVWFVYGVLTVATFTFLYWLRLSGTSAVENSVAVLIVACPCVIALAAPLTLSLAISRAAGRGILIKSGDVLQRMAQAGTIWLDKTGTLTQGQTRLVQWWGDRDLAAQVAALESRSSHPLAAALQQESLEQVLNVRLGSLPPVEQAAQDPRGGIRGVVAGSELVIGSRKYFADLGLEIPPALKAQATASARTGLTVIYVARQRVVCGLATIGDKLRSDAAATVSELQRRGWQVGILSGDQPDTVAVVAGQLGVPPESAWGGLSPEDKTARVRSSNSKEVVVMVGDGLNDSAALAAASVGVAVKGGAEASLAAAPVYLSRGGLTDLLQLASASRQTMTTIHVSLVISILYNTFSVGLATMGLIHPLIAALMMPLSSLTTIILAYCNPAFSAREPWPHAGHLAKKRL
ncbi:MAG: heavy metal translocating P-type ATPase [Planctomycetota bacterium]